MKKTVAFFIIAAMLISTFGLCFANADEKAYKEFYVSTNGNDLNDGSKGSPFATLERAKEEVRKYNSDMKGDIIVNIESGRYALDKTFELDDNDSGSNGYNVIYRGDKSNLPIISGAKQIGGFKEDEGGLWSTYLSDIDSVRALFVNGKIAQRARSQNKVFGNGHYKDEDDTYEVDGFYADKSSVGIYKNPKDVELVWGVCWKTIIMHCEDIIQDPNDENQVIIKFVNPVWNTEHNKNNNISSAPTAPGWEIGFAIENAFELLDEPGEFYFDKTEKKLYYMPREGEDMNTAEVLCPVLDKVMTAKGAEYDKKLHNVIFEDICFAHTTWKILDEFCFKSNQSEACQTTYVPARRTPGSVEISYADSIVIRSCQFYGLETIGLSIEESVNNSEFTGNVFSDIGCSAFCIGQKWHDEWIEPQNTDGPSNVFFRKPWYGSNQTKFSFKYLNADENDEFYSEKSVWKSDPIYDANGVIPWIKADLMKEYNIDSIKLSFKDVEIQTVDCEPGVISDIEKSNYEVLISNDESFNDYKVLKTVTSPVDTLEIKGPTDGKYRYLMIRKTKAEPFAISGLWVYSYDEKPKGKRGLCINNKFTNNYITRIGRLHRGAQAVSAFYTEGLLIDHNEIENVPYTAISLGWGWTSDSETAKNNEVSNNYINKYTQQNNDSGAIYTIANQPGTTIHGNYMKNQGNKYAAIYPDEGASMMNIWDNVMVNTAAPLFVWLARDHDLTIWNTYATITSNKNAGTNCIIEDINMILPNKLGPDASKIVFNAGLTDEYEYIRNRIPDNKTNFYYGPYSVVSFNRKAQADQPGADGNNPRIFKYIETIQNILDYGHFGIRPWNYAQSYKYEMENLIERATDSYNKVKDYSNGHVDELLMIKDCLISAMESIQHLSEEEMYSIANDIILTGKEEKIYGGYQKGTIEELKKEVNEIKKLPNQTEAEKYMIVSRLEDAIDKADSRKYSDEIEYVYVKDGKTEIDRTNKSIKITVANGTDLTKIKPVFVTVGETTTAVDLSKIKPGKEMLLPLYNPSVKKYSYWKFLIQQEDLSDSTDKITENPNDWHNSNENTDFINNGGLQLQPWAYPYMFKKPVKGKLSFSINVDTVDVKTGTSFIMSSKSGEDIEYDGLYYKNTYYMITLKGDRAELYKVESGKPTLIDSVENSEFIYGENNDISLEVKPEDTYDRIMMTVNGKTVLNSATASIGSEGYFGILNKTTKVILSEVKNVQEAQ